MLQQLQMLALTAEQWPTARHSRAALCADAAVTNTVDRAQIAVQ